MKKFPEPIDYFPGHKPSTPAFRPIPEGSSDPRDQIFQFDWNFHHHMANKRLCRAERLSKYYQKIEPIDLTIINDFIRDKVVESLGTCILYMNDPEYFDVFDALAMQVAEDLAVYDTKNQRVVALHLCHANGWSAEGNIGKSFEHIHEEVKNSKGQLIVPAPNKFVKKLMKLNSSIERVGAISFNKYADLNRHPDKKELRSFDPTTPSLFMRVERQTVTPFAETDQFLFTIKTHFYDCSDPKYIDSAIDIFTNPHPDLYSKWFVDEYKDQVLPWLESVKNAKSI